MNEVPGHIQDVFDFDLANNNKRDKSTINVFIKLIQIEVNSEASCDCKLCTTVELVTKYVGINFRIIKNLNE